MRSFFYDNRIYFYRRANRDRNAHHRRLLYVLLDPAQNDQIENHIAARQHQKYCHQPPAFDFAFVTRTADQVAILATGPIYQHVLAASAPKLTDNKLDDNREKPFSELLVIVR